MSAYPPVSMSAAGKSSIVLVNLPVNAYFQSPPAYALGLVCTMSNGASLTYDVEVTADQQPSASGNWNKHNILHDQTSSQNDNIAYPCTGVRLSVSNYVSGSVNLGVAQWP